MSRPVVTAVAHRWEAAMAERLGTSGRAHIVARCADVPDLLGAVAAGLGEVVLVSVDLRGVDRDVVGRLQEEGVEVVGVYPPGDESGERTLRQWGLVRVVPADSDTDTLVAALDGAEGPLTVPGQPGAGVAVAVPSAVADAEGGGPHAVPAEDPPAAAVVEHEPRGRIVAVWGPAGAPGRSTVAVNLAVELARTGDRVLLVDADTYGASVAQLLGVLDEAPGVLAAVRTAGAGALDRVSLERIAPEVGDRLRVLTGVPRPDRWTELREHAFADVLRTARSTARWTVVDTGFCLETDEELSFDTRAPRRNGATLRTLEEADIVIAVGRADPVGLQRLIRGLAELGEVTATQPSVVLTQVRNGPLGSRPSERVRELLDRHAGVGEVVLVPDDRAALDAALLAGAALAEVRPGSPAREAMASLAARLSGATTRPRRHRGLLRGRI